MILILTLFYFVFILEYNTMINYYKINKYNFKYLMVCNNNIV